MEVCVALRDDSMNVKDHRRRWSELRWKGSEKQVFVWVRVETLRSIVILHIYGDI